MNKILLFGAGRSSTALINYLLDQSKLYDWALTIVDSNKEMAEQKINGHPCGTAVCFDIFNVAERTQIIQKNDIVISLLPARLHIEVARDCVQFNKHLMTASYVSSKMEKLAEEAHAKGLIFMGELGLDPGLDHMSAMDTIEELQAKGAHLESFCSYTGGLIAPESDTNPWHYKISWNPRNIVLAGQGTAQYQSNGKLKYIPYHQLFERYDVINIEGHGPYEMYANRDSLIYREKYNLKEIPTLLRGTLRNIGYCDAWNALIQLGLTDDSYPIVDSAHLTYAELIEAFLQKSALSTLEERVAQTLGISIDSEVMSKLKWLGLFSDKKILLKNASPAKIIEELIKVKWKLEDSDKDLIIMQHEFKYKLNDKRYFLTSTMTLKGNNSVDTAMSKLVGLPLGIFVKLVMTGQVKSIAKKIPVVKAVYKPILKELESFGVSFKEHLKEI